MSGPLAFPQRRSFLTGINAGLASVTAMALGGVAMARGKSAGIARWEPARHEKDDWLDSLPGKHRLVFDTITADVLGDAITFANNFIRVNQSDYGLKTSDLAIVVVVRHRATPFGYNDAIWAKYGKTLAARARFEDPKTKQPPRANIFNSTEYGDLLPNRATTLEVLSQQGVQLAVCSLATHAYSGLIAQELGGKAEAIYSELVSNLVNNARMVPAGIVAVGRAQERGYSLVSG